MDAVTNITTAASKAIWGETGEDTAHNETGGKEPVSGQLGNVAVGEPYDKGNIETPKSETPSALGTTATKATTDTSTAYDGTATNGKPNLYNPILPATPDENGATDYTTSARRASAISGDSQNGEHMSPTLQNVAESEKVADSATAQKNGAQRNGITLEGKEDAKKTSNAGVSSGSAGPKRQSARRGSSAKSIDRGELAFRSVSREAERKANQRSALSPLHKTESERRRAAQAAAAEDGVGYDDEAGVPDSSVLKARKPSLKDKIKAKFGKH